MKPSSQKPVQPDTVVTDPFYHRLWQYIHQTEGRLAKEDQPLLASLKSNLRRCSRKA